MTDATHRTNGKRSPLRSLRAAAAPFAKTALLRTGGYATLRRLAPSRRIAILRYHAICGDEGAEYADPSICISPAAFEQHVRYLAANYRVLPLDEAVRRLASGSRLPANAVAITFDDGYADNLEAARTLNRHGLSATFFITAGCLAGEQPFWLSEIRQLLFSMPDGPVRLAAPGVTLELTLGDQPSRQAATRTLTRVIKSHPIPVREALRDQLRQAAGAPVRDGYMLTWEQLAEMQRLGMIVGAHTLTHPNLPSAGGRDAHAEIAGSKARLEQELGTSVTLFSYPNGGAERYYTPDLQRMVKECGFEAALTSRNGFAGPSSDLYALERIEVEERLEDLVFALEVERFAFAPAR